MMLVPYHETLIQKLQDDEIAIGFLNEALMDTDDLFRDALRIVLKARGVILPLSDVGEIDLRSVQAGLNSVGLSLTVVLKSNHTTSNEE